MVGVRIGVMVVIGIVVMVRTVAVVMAMILRIAVIVATAEADHREGRVGDQGVPGRGVRVRMRVRVGMVMAVIVRVQRRPGQAMLQAEGLVAAR